MPALPRSASKKAKKERMHEEMSKFKRGGLHSGSKGGPVVTSREQAAAIGLSVSGQSRDGKRKSGGARNRSRASGRR